MVKRRQKSRIQIEFPVHISGFTAQGVQFVQDAVARNISCSGALLSGINHELKSGDLIEIQYEEKRARFKVVRIGGSKTLDKPQVAVHRMEGERCPWEQAPPRTIDKAEEKSVMLIESITDYAIFMLDLSGHVVSWNAGAERLKGYRADGIVGQHFSRFYSEEDAARGTPAKGLDIAAREGRFEEEGWRVRKDGSLFWANVIITALHDETGQLQGFAKVTRDVTGRNQAEKKMANALRYAQKILDTSPIGIITYKASGEAVAANPVSTQLVGASVEQVRTQNFRHLESWRRSGLLTLAEEALATGAPCHGEVHMTSTFDQEFWVNARLIPFAYEDETHLLVLLEDITERKQAEKFLKLFRTLVDQSNDILQIVDPETMRFLDVNEKACTSLGYTREEILHMSVYDIDPTVSEPGRTKVFDELRKSGFGIFKGLHRRKDGSTFPVEVSMRLLHIDRSYVVCTARDISERERMEEVLRNAEEKYRRIFEEAVIGIFQKAPDGRLLSANPALAQIFGYDSPAELMAGLTDVAHHGYVDSSQRELFKRQLEEKGSVHNLEYQAYRKDGSKIWLLENAHVIRNSSGATLYYEGTVADITDRKVAEEKIQYSAYYDALTGLPNRALLLDRLTKALASARRQKDKVALLFLDLDQFKDINDSFGHPIGDLLLQGVAERFKGWVREQDTVARISGDEFVVVLTRVEDVSDVAVAAQRLMDTMTAEFVVPGHAVRITCSLGISIFPEHGADGETLIKHADVAMYCAKDQGRNNFRFFTEDMNAQIVERLTLENSLRLALDKNELFLVYQPQMDIGTGRIIGLEALLRWQHPELGLVPSDKFIQIAENSGLIMPIGEWVFRTACSQARKWQDEGLLAVPVAVNISAVQFRQEDFSKLIGSVLRETGLASQYLELELTESVLLSDADMTLSVLQDLKAMGLKLAIDDFGTGYSSLSYLRRFPISKLKIDRSFIQDVAVNPDDAAITTAIIAMAKQLKLKVIAEGVEDDAQLSFLRAHHCDEIQGYYFSQPLTVDAVADLLRGTNHSRANVS